jgi:hypothetical protein
MGLLSIAAMLATLTVLASANRNVTKDWADFKTNHGKSYKDQATEAHR